MADQKQQGGGGSQQTSASDLVKDAQGVAAKLADTAQQKARGVLSTAEEKAREIAEAKKREAADQVDSVAKVVDSVAEQVASAMPPAADYVRGVASEFHKVSSTLRDSSLDELMDEARRFAQARPGLVLGGAVLLGFGLARFLKASADRREARMQQSFGSGGRRDASGDWMTAGRGQPQRVASREPRTEPRTAGPSHPPGTSTAATAGGGSDGR